MSIQVRHVNPHGTRVYMGQIMNEDVNNAIQRLMTELNIRAGSLRLIGSVTDIEFRSYDFSTKQRRPPTTYTGELEIVDAYGHLSYSSGAPHMHLHATITIPHNGTWVAGGHVQRATAFVLEFTIWAYDGADLERAHNEESGLYIWDVPDF